MIRPRESAHTAPYDRRVPPASQRAYLDHAATTPLVPAALEAFHAAAGVGGNASALHASGRRARAIVEDAREQIAAVLDAHPTEVVFTSGGTEADNLAIAGMYAARTARDPRPPGIVISAIEHHAVLEPVEALQRRGAQVCLVAPSRSGVVGADAVAAAIDDLEEQGAAAGVISLMWANNEIGTIQPVVEVASVARERGIAVHSDAVQAVGPCDISFRESGLDALSVSAHKLGGPMGVGALLVARDAGLEPIMHGGGHERGLRSGTVPVALVAAFGAAVEAAHTRRAAESARLVGLRDRLIEGALGLDLDILVGGAWTPGSAVDRLPGNVHLIVPGCEPDSLLFLLDAARVEASTGSACQAGVPGRSHVVDALGLEALDTDTPAGVVRLTLGHTSTDHDVDAALDALALAIPPARAAALAAAGGA